jgi:hypothetical protein
MNCELLLFRFDNHYKISFLCLRSLNTYGVFAWFHIGKPNFTICLRDCCLDHLIVLAESACSIRNSDSLGRNHTSYKGSLNYNLMFVAACKPANGRVCAHACTNFTTFKGILSFVTSDLGLRFVVFVPYFQERSEMVGVNFCKVSDTIFSSNNFF